MDALSIDARPGEPLAAWFSLERRVEGAFERRFECASFGDLVSGRSWRPSDTARWLVLAVHDLGRDKDAASLVAAALGWARRGVATAAIDLPLHGERRNAKLSPRAVAAGAPGAQADLALFDRLVAQALRDLARALDALATLSPLPSVACVAFGDSAPIASAFASLDSRVARLAALGAPREGPRIPIGRNAVPLAWLARPDDLLRAL